MARAVQPPATPSPARPPSVETQAMRGWALLALRQGVMSLVTIGGVFALSLLLVPAEFALYGYAATAMLLAASVGDLGLGANVIRAGASNARVSAGFGLQLVLWTAACGVAALVLVALDPYPFPLGIKLLLLAVFFLFALQTLPTALLERKLQFGRIAAIESGQRIVFVVVAVVLAAATGSPWAIAIAGVAAAAIGYASATAAARWRWRPRLDLKEAEFTGFSSEWWQGRVASQLNYAAYPLLGGLLFAADEVGLMVWALAVTQVPALLAPLMGRAVFPLLTRSDPGAQVAVYHRLYRSLLFVGLPGLAALLAFAEPITVGFFGEEWRDAVPLVRLECGTTLLGIILTPAFTLLYAIDDPRRVKRVVVLWAAGVWAVTPLVALAAGYLALSITQLAVALVVLVVAERIIRERRSYSIVAEARPALVAFALAAAAGVGLERFATSRPSTLLLALAVMGLGLALTVALRGGTNLREVVGSLRDARAA